MIFHRFLCANGTVLHVRHTSVARHRYTALAIAKLYRCAVQPVSILGIHAILQYTVTLWKQQQLAQEQKPYNSNFFFIQKNMLRIVYAICIVHPAFFSCCRLCEHINCCFIMLTCHCHIERALFCLSSASLVAFFRFCSLSLSLCFLSLFLSVFLPLVFLFF